MVERYEIKTLPSGATIRELKTDTSIFPDKIIECGVFWDRFTLEEQEEISSHTNPKAKAFVTYLSINNYVNLSNQKVINVINKMEQFGLIGTGRAAEILK